MDSKCIKDFFTGISGNTTLGTLNLKCHLSTCDDYLLDECMMERNQSIMTARKQSRQVPFRCMCVCVVEGQRAVGWSDCAILWTPENEGRQGSVREKGPTPFIEKAGQMGSVSLSLSGPQCSMGRVRCVGRIETRGGGAAAAESPRKQMEGRWP